MNNTIQINNCELLKQKVEDVYNKYQNNPHLLDKLKQIIDNLDTTLQTEETNRQKKIEKASEIWNEQHIFMENIFKNDELSYLPNNNSFFILDQYHYKLIKEDDLHHKILSNISNNSLLSNYKYKTRSLILKKIKERQLFAQIPPPIIIQNMLDFFESEIFSKEATTIYFFCIVGDYLLKKNNSHIYFINNSLRRVIWMIDEIIYNKNDFTPNINNITFITKYHENQDRSKYKLLWAKNTIKQETIKEYLNVHSVNFMVVCCYYSHKYGSANKYLDELSTDTNIYNKNCYNNVHFLSNHDNDYIIDLFMEQCIEKVEQEDTHEFDIPWKNMHYIWKIFLEQNYIPNMLYSAQLKDILKTKIEFNEETDNFLNSTSKHLPKISSFLQFWEKHIYIVENEKEFLYELDIYDLEIEELVMLYKNTTNSYLSENEMSHIINHFFSQQLIIENKCILNVKCSLWNKFQDVTHFFNHVKQTKLLPFSNDTISIHELYQYYGSFSKTQHKWVVTNTYFDKYVSNILLDFVSKDTFLLKKWLSL